MLVVRPSAAKSGRPCGVTLYILLSHRTPGGPPACEERVSPEGGQPVEGLALHCHMTVSRDHMIAIM